MIKISTRIVLFVALIYFIPISPLLKAQSFTNVLIFDFASCECTGAAAPSGSVTNLTISNYTRGGGISSNAGGGIYNSAGFAETSEGNAKSANDYVTFTLTPASGYQFTLTSFQFSHMRSATGPPNYAVYASHDGYATPIATGTVPTSLAAVTVDLTTPAALAADFTNRTAAVTFRVYAWGGAATGTYRHDNVYISGSRSLIATPNIQISQGATGYNTGSTFGYGTIATGSSLCQTFTITNTGTANLTIDAPALSGADASAFAIDNFPAPLPFSIAASASQTFDLCFDPTASGNKTAKIAIATNVTGKNPYEINLTGTATEIFGVFLTTPDGAAFAASHESNITWTSIGVPTAELLTVEYAEDGANYITLGTTTAGAGSFSWRPDYYHTTWNGVLFAEAGSIRIRTESYSSVAQNITVGMNPCVVTTAGSTQTIALANFETTTPANNWTYTETKTSDAMSGPTAALFYGTLDPATPINATPGGSRSYVHTDGSATCESGAASQATTTVSFASKNVSTYINKYITLRISSLNLTGTSPCGSTGIGNDVDDYMTVEVRLNGGSWQQVLLQRGFGNLTYSFASGTSRTNTPSGLVYGSISSISGATTGTLRIDIPDAANTVELRVKMANNRRDENWAIDDVTLVGDLKDTQALSFSRDCYLKVADFASLLPAGVLTGSLTASVASATNGDTDILIDGSLSVTGNLTLADNAIIHLPIGTNLDIAGSASASTATCFVAVAPHNSEPGTGLVRNVTTAATAFPVGFYVDNNASCTKSRATVLLQATGASTGGKFVVRAQPTDNANNRPAAAYPYFDNPAGRHERSAHALWHIAPQVVSGNESANLTLIWDPASLGSLFSAGLSVIGHWNGTQWEQLYNARTAASVTANAVQSFSPFMVGNENEVFPVTLMAFWGSITADGRAADLYWRTASELNCSHFELERTANPSDLNSFAPITILQGAGTTNAPQNYRHTDANLPTGTQALYYRLRQVDFNGAFQYSNIVEIQLRDAAQPTFSLYPNPATGPVTLTLSPSPVQQQPTLEVISATGSRVFLQTADLPTLNISFNQLLPDLAQGIYLVRILADGQWLTTKLKK